tara:strand:+ start:45640 stop:46554 length:915 start_codon:yes stop_codon:yes gene_type:complete
MQIRKFIYKTGLLFLLIGFCIGLFEFSLQIIPNDYTFKHNYLHQNGKKIQVLFMGNSHVYRGVKAENIDREAFNASYISQSLDVDLIILNKHLNKLPSLELVVLNFSYQSLYNSVKVGKEYWRVKNYNLYYNLQLSSNLEDYSEILSQSFTKNLRRLKTEYLIKENLVFSSEKGSGLLEGHENLKATAKKAVKRHTDKGVPGYHETIKKELNDIIRILEERQIKVILVTPPASEYYNELLDTIQTNRSEKFLKMLAANNSNVFYYNFLKDKDFEIEDFYDADHLNEKGALKYTSKLNNILNEEI